MKSKYTLWQILNVFVSKILIAFKHQYIIRKTKELERTIASIATADHFWVILRWLYRQCNVE